MTKTRLTWLDPETSTKLRQRSDWKALAIFLSQTLLCTLWFLGETVDYSLPFNIVFSLSSGFIIGQLFVIGHDACHQALAKHRWVNEWIGRLCFLPALHSYSLWNLEHNINHHHHTNIKSLDPSWSPLSKDEFDNLPRSRQWLERIYRSIWGPGLYYMNEVWMKKLCFPISAEARSKWRHYLPDSILVVAVLVLQPVLLLTMGNFLAPSKSWWELLLLSWIIPFLSWNWFMGNVVYLHHTHPCISWFASDPPFALAERQILMSTHVVFPPLIDSLLYNIMAQNAHHLKPAIPFYNLGEAQGKLETSNPGHVLTYHWTPLEHLRITQTCKLYDFDRHCWTDFNGRPTASTRLAQSVSGNGDHITMLNVY